MAKKPTKKPPIDWETLIMAGGTTDEQVLRYLADGKYHTCGEVADGVKRGNDAVRGAMRRLMGRQSVERAFAAAPISGQRVAVYRLYAGR